jgi:hypothetical protein
VVIQAWMAYDWLVHDALPGLLEAAELPELADVLLALPWCATQPANYREVAAGIWVVNRMLIDLMDTTAQLDARQAWGWSWGAQAALIEHTGIPAAVMVIRDNMARVAAGPPASTARLLTQLFVIPTALADSMHTDACTLLAAMQTTNPTANPAYHRTPRPPSVELSAPVPPTTH